MNKKKTEFWVSSCLRKKKLQSDWADKIIKTAQKEGNFLRKYLCPICLFYHVTSKPDRNAKFEKNTEN